jgi:hypothetical protein
LRQLHQKRGERLGDRLEIAERQQAVGLADRDSAQTVQSLICVALVEIEMVPGVHRDIGASLPLRPDPERDLLRQGAARQKDRRRFPSSSAMVASNPVISSPVP